MAASPVAVIGPLNSDSVLAIAVEDYGKQTIVYQGTENGEIVEVGVTHLEKKLFFPRDEMSQKVLSAWIDT